MRATFKTLISISGRSPGTRSGRSRSEPKHPVAHNGQGASMGTSVIAYWPGITEEQINAQRRFLNDARAWATWMPGREDSSAVIAAIRTLKAEAILTLKTDGWDDDDVAWVSPQQLREAVN